MTKNSQLYDDGHYFYDETGSALYDIIQSSDDVELPAEIDCLAKLAGDGPILEVAAGTGRLAIPLARRGFSVRATDASEDMLAILAKKAEGISITVRQERLPYIGGNDKYSLVFIAVNSIWNVNSAVEQRAFIGNTVDHLLPGGVFLVEMFVANPQKYVSTQFTEGPLQATRTSQWSPVTQQVKHRFDINNTSNNTRTVLNDTLRVIFPAELILIAELSGLKPKHLWSNWDADAFDENSSNMIAVFERSS